MSFRQTAQVGGIDYTIAASTMAELAAYYPGFDSWYWSKVVPGMSDGTRFVDTVSVGGMIVAVAISKRTAQEKKLCTVFVKPESRGRGHGIRLIDRACLWLGTQYPLATLPEEKLADFAPVIDRRGWRLTAAIPSAYRQGKAEYVLNGDQGQGKS